MGHNHTHIPSCHESPRARMLVPRRAWRVEAGDAFVGDLGERADAARLVFLCACHRRGCARAHMSEFWRAVAARVIWMHVLCRSVTRLERVGPVRVSGTRSPWVPCALRRVCAQPLGSRVPSGVAVEVAASHAARRRPRRGRANRRTANGRVPNRHAPRAPGADAMERWLKVVKAYVHDPLRSSPGTRRRPAATPHLAHHRHMLQARPATPRRLSAACSRAGRRPRAAHHGGWTHHV